MFEQKRLAGRHLLTFESQIILAEVCKLNNSIKKLGGSRHYGEIWTLKLMGFFFQKHLMFCSLWSTFFGPQNARFLELPPPGPLTALSWTRILCIYSAGVCPFHLVASFTFGNHKSNVRSVERRGIKIKKTEVQS
jgi:hypothetical protein